MSKVLNSEDVLARIEAGLNKRYRAEKRFQWYGRIAVFIGIFSLFALFTDIVSKGYGSFIKTVIALEVNWSSEILGIDATNLNTEAGLQQLRKANFDRLLKTSIYASQPQITKRRDKSKLRRLFSSGVIYQLEDMLRENPQLINQTTVIWVTADDLVDTYYKNDFDPTLEGKFNQLQITLLKSMAETGQLRKVFNDTFFSAGDSREPEQAGIWGAAMGSLLTLMVTLLLSFPIGISAAIYLEEYAPRNRFTSIIEVNINNLAAVPSIIIGLLGLAVFINFFNMPRSAPLVGGLVLTLMTLPTIIIAGRASVKSVPPSIREAALGIGASHTQMVFHHVLPLAMPGMLTGSIIGMARALGETAPLLMIGMIAFIVDVPQSLTDSSTVLPVQIFLWADSPERAFVEKTSGAIIVLLAFLVLMNATAVFLRNRLERRW